jgi:hypothetical protein
MTRRISSTPSPGRAFPGELPSGPVILLKGVHGNASGASVVTFRVPRSSARRSGTRGDIAGKCLPDLPPAESPRSRCRLRWHRRAGPMSSASLRTRARAGLALVERRRKPCVAVERGLSAAQLGDRRRTVEKGSAFRLERKKSQMFGSTVA